MDGGRLRVACHPLRLMEEWHALRAVGQPRQLRHQRSISDARIPGCSFSL